MKTKWYLLMVVCVSMLTFTSCSKDDGIGPEEKENPNGSTDPNKKTYTMDQIYGSYYIHTIISPDGTRRELEAKTLTNYCFIFTSTKTLIKNDYATYDNAVSSIIDGNIIHADSAGDFEIVFLQKPLLWIKSTSTGETYELSLYSK